MFENITVVRILPHCMRCCVVVWNWCMCWLPQHSFSILSFCFKVQVCAIRGQGTDIMPIEDTQYTQILITPLWG